MLTGLYDFEISTEFKEDKTYYFVFETSWVLGAPKTVFTSTIKEIDPSQAAELMRTYTPREPSVKQAVTIGANPSDALAPGHRG
jgi:hypothetical protein